jgi:mRNA interferase MazF
MTKGKVVLVPFPFDDLSSAKLRPAVCLTDPIGPHNHIILAFITSRMPSDLKYTDLVMGGGSPGFTQTGLKVTSVLRLHRLLTVSSSIIERELGNLPKVWQVQIADKLRHLFSL